MNYKELIEIKNLYNDTPQKTIKDNIKAFMKDNNIKHSQIAELLNISTHTAYSYTNAANNNKPELYNLLILSSYLNVTIEDIFK